MALVEATRNGRISDVKRLLDEGCFVDTTDEYSFTALHIASSTRGNAKILRVLLRNGADPCIKSKYGYNAIQYAFAWGATFKIIKLLLIYGADIYTKGPSGWTILDTANYKHQCIIIREFLRFTSATFSHNNRMVYCDEW